jgi:hypothetical protein
MKVYPAPFILILLSVLSCDPKDKYDPSQYLSRQDQDTLLYKTLRYSAKLPPTATHKTKFNQVFDSYYKSLLADHTLRYYYTTGSNNFFLITRQARSVTPMREAIGGKIKMDLNGNVVEYDELFRTWKMNADTVDLKGRRLFDIMVSGRDLSAYYTKHKRDQYIEYPDDRFYFDRIDKRWHDRALDSMQIN